MARSTRDKSISESLDDFQHAPTDHGLSLDQLSESFARLLGSGEIPYDDSAEPSTSAGLAAGDVVAEVPAESVTPVGSSDSIPVSPETIVEAILFVGEPSNEPISSRQIASLMRGVRAAEVEQVIEQLNEKYSRQGCPYFIESVGKGFRMSLRPEFHHVRDQFFGRVRQASLTQVAMTALALVAYQQPITKQQVTELGSPEAARSLTALVRRGLLRLERRPGDKPRDSCYQTTDRFLELFGLTSLDDLPRTQDLDG